MNSKTAKLLNRVALILEQPPKKVRAVWYSLPWTERARNREQLWGLVAKQPGRLAKGKADQQEIKNKRIDRFLQIVKPYREKEEKARRKAKKLRRKQRQSNQNKRQSIFGKVKSWMGGLSRGQK